MENRLRRECRRKYVSRSVRGNRNGKSPKTPKNHRQTRGRNNNPLPRKNVCMGFTYVQKLVDDDDLDSVVLELSSERNGFAKLLESERISEDLIVLVIRLLSKICDVTFNHSKVHVLQTVLQSPFVNKLTKFIAEIVSQTPKETSRNKFLWSDTDSFWKNIIKISKEVHDLLPYLACDVVRKILLVLQINLPHIQQMHNIHVSDEIISSITSLLEIVEKTTAELDQNLNVKASGSTCNKRFEEPPDDFRAIPVVPTVEEVTSSKTPYYRSNVVDRPYDNVHHYLDVQFRLLREDFVAPLRKGICNYIKNSKKIVREKIPDVRIYDKIQFLTTETLNDQSCFRLQFDFSQKKRTFKYENSRRFMFGSLVCFTKDKFVTLIFGKIVKRDNDLLEQGQLIVGFDEDVIIEFETNYLMVESSVYFEPYYQVLNVLKRINYTDFPMKKYIISVEKTAGPPSYLSTMNPNYYQVDGTKFNPLNFPEEKLYGFNDSQFAAYKAALTQEFCIIQGPPGTGKTYLGLKIVHTLLNNKHAWYNRTPLLVICYTNTALDQFLEGILPVTQDLLRIGNQSKNEALNQYNIKTKRKRINPAVRQKCCEVRDTMTDVRRITECLQQIEENESVQDFFVFQRVVPDFDQTWFYRESPVVIKEWLFGGREDRCFAKHKTTIKKIANPFKTHERRRCEEDDQSEDLEFLTNKNEFDMDDVFDDLHIPISTPMTSLADIRKHMEELSNNLRELEEGPDDLRKRLDEVRIHQELNQLNDEYEYLRFRLEEGVHGPKQPPNIVDFQNPNRMYAKDRWQLYFFWLHLYKESLQLERSRLNEKFKTVYRVYNEFRDIDDTQTMKEHLVVGMTTTGAARLQSSLQALKSPIVIVEEAAEVLEAHIVAALTNSCQHLILIGDHQQLRPSTASYNIETLGKLGISMFERMVINKVQCYTLDIQHRMRPEISRLVCPTIYPLLKDHETTLDRPHILGVQNDLYFIDHQQPETACQDASKKNVHEAQFLISLARHLILNGYQPENITILVAYLGQFFEMQREKKKHDLLMKKVRIAVLDNYQGEECEIILLSLVRNNAENKIGFLKIENRVCVALSRARNGFYIMGNMTMLCENSEIWPQIRNTLTEQNALGPSLSLSCQVHRTVTPVSKADDFSNVLEGGCNLQCDTVMSCGHICKRLCHATDRDHSRNRCYEDCIRGLCNDPTHICKKKCYEECGPCSYPVVCDLNCGHKATLKCHENPDEYKCQTSVSARLPCDHVTDKLCSDDPVTVQCPHPCDTRVDPCGHACTKLCHIRSDPDHLKYKCMKGCEKQQIGCKDPENPAHKCSRICFQECAECEIGVEKQRRCGHVETIACKIDIEQVKCQKPCKKYLPCGHKCKRKCFEECAPCQKMVEKITDCNHKIQIQCYQEADRILCSGKCSKLLPCGHKCTKRCNQECTVNCKEMVKCDLVTPCGHQILTIQCYLKNSNDVEALMKHCTKPCVEQLKCGDICSGTCGECIQGRIHKRCTKKCGRILVCNHECPLPCRQACKPCQKPCEYKCKHSKCKKKCGEPCVQCQEHCPRRCKHQICKRKCGDICNTPPCTKKCPKKIQCGHYCSGFCGDPCPQLCKKCDKKKLQDEMCFFGTEDNKDAIFVQLKDCGHILENSGLERWLSQNSNVVRAKECPMCRTPILTTERYSHYVKEAMKDVMNIKKKEFGALGANNDLRKDLLEELENMKKQNKDLCYVCPKLNRAFDTLTGRLLPTREGHRQPINSIELNAVQSKMQVLGYIVGCFGQFDQSYHSMLFKFDSEKAKTAGVITQMSLLLKLTMQDDDAITMQEIEDIEQEINRLERMVQLDELRNRSIIFAEKHARSLNSDIRSLLCTSAELVNTKSKFTEEIDNTLKINLQELGNKIEETIKIVRERREIVAAIGLKPGHWFKCPNGHYYAIGECGGAMQVGKCPDCGVSVGGTQHRLLSGNTFAPEMDNAMGPAWPGVHL